MLRGSPVVASLVARAARAGAFLARCRARWDLAAALFFVVVSTVVYLNNPASQNPGSDGYYSWVYARSLAYDGDLDFTNDYALCGDDFAVGWNTAAHRPANIFYFGPAVLWTPAIWVLAHFVHGADPRVAGACVGTVPRLVLLLSSLAGGALVALASALARRFVGPKTAAFAALLTALGGHVLYYTALNASYSHVYDALCVAAYVYFVVRLRESPERARYAWLAGLFFALAVLQRSVNVVFFVFAVACLLPPRPAEALRTTTRRSSSARTSPEGARARSLARLAEIGAMGLALGVAPLALVNHSVFGRYTLYTHGPHFLHLGHAHPLLLLFDERGGFFASAPVLWLAVPGLFLAMRRSTARWMAAPLLVIGAFECYASSAALDWQGARRLLNLTPLLVLAMALAIDRAKQWLAASPGRVWVCTGLAAVLLVGWRNASVCYAFAHGKVPWDTPLPASALYGESEKQALTAVEDAIGSPAVLPAAWAFALRYGLKPSAFGEAIHPRWYSRNYHTLAYEKTGLTFTASEARVSLSGFRLDSADSGACMEGLRARAVFAAQWPFATRARLTFDATEAQDLSVRSRTFLGATTEWPVESRLLPGRRQQVVLRIPPGGFDSGVNELVFERRGSGGTLCLFRIDFVDDEKYPSLPVTDAGTHVFWWSGGDRYEEGAGAPSLAVGSADIGPWVVEVHETGSPPGRLEYGAGSDGNPRSRGVYGQRGFRPRIVAAAAGGAVIEVHQAEPGPGPLLYERGAWRANEAGVAVDWAEAVPYAVGFHPAIAAAAGRVVEAHMETAQAGPLSFRVGSYAAAGPIDWGEGHLLENVGANPAVALAPAATGAPEMVVVEVHQETAKFGALSYRTGTLDRAGALSWGRSRRYDTGFAPCIAVVGRRVVEVHQGSDDAGALWFQSGVIDADGAVRWEGARKYDDGALPALAVDPLRGEGMEVHQGQLGVGSLWRRSLTVYP